MNNNFIRSNPNNNNKNRNRNRNNNNNRRNTGGGGNLGGGGSNKVFDSNGPDIKLRGTTQTIAEKYMQLGRDAQSSGDSVAAENYYQHAEHYYRLWAANQPVGQSLIMSRKLGEEEFDEEGSDENGEGDSESGNLEPVAPEGNQPLEGGAVDPNAPQGEGQQPRQNRNNNFRDNNNRDNNGRNFRPRWPNNNRNNRNYENRDGVEQVPAAASEGGVEFAPVPAPAAMVAEADSQWEAPSFLQRPTPAVVEAQQVSEAVSEDVPPVRKPRARKPRVEAETPVDDGSNAPE